MTTPPFSPPNIPLRKEIPEAMRPHTGAASRSRASAKIERVANHLAIWGYTELHCLAGVLGIKADSAANTVRNYIKRGLLTRHPMSHSPASVLLATSELEYFVSATAREAINGDRLLTHASRVNPTTYIHNVLAQRSALFLIKHQEKCLRESVVELVPERILPTWMERNHVYRSPKEWLRMKFPDVLFVTESGRRIAVEMEENAKDPAERDRIIYVYSQLIAMGIISEVWYASTRRDVLKLYQESNRSLVIRRWIYSANKEKWRLEYVSGSDGKVVETWERPETIQKAFRYLRMDSLAHQYYPFITKPESKG
jgi:hypothetical protein